MVDSNDVYEQCLLEYGGADDGSEAVSHQLLRCVASGVSLSVDEALDVAADSTSSEHDFVRSVFLVYSAALVFYMQAGFAMLCAGCVRKKNVQNTMLKNLLDACGAAIGFFVIGYGFAFGGMDRSSATKTFAGHTNFGLYKVEDLAFWLFQYAFSAASATIVAGTLAERCQMAAYLCYSVMLSALVYPIIAHAVWSPNGFMSCSNIEPLFGTGVIDFAGSGVVHLTGGTTALFATIILGPRRGRFYDESGRALDIPKEMPGHSIALQMLGTFTLWFGWYGFNAGSSLLTEGDAEELPHIVALAGVNTTLAGGSAGLVALFMNLILLERYTGEPFFDLTYLMNGALSGLVAITGSCGVIKPWSSLVIGAIAGLLYMIGHSTLIKLRLDDAVDAIPVHMVNGVWGLIAVGIFADPEAVNMSYKSSNGSGFIYTGDFTLLGSQILCVLFIVGWVMFIMFPFFVWLDWRGWFRSDPLEEIVGLDTSYHGGLVLLNDGEGDDEIKPEYISAFKKQREENRDSHIFYAKRNNSLSHTQKPIFGQPLDELQETQYDHDMQGNSDVTTAIPHDDQISDDQNIIMEEQQHDHDHQQIPVDDAEVNHKDFAEQHDQKHHQMPVDDAEVNHKEFADQNQEFHRQNSAAEF